MKQILLLTCALLLLVNCSKVEQASVVEQAVKNALFLGLEGSTGIEFEIPDSGPFRSIRQLNFIINGGQYNNKAAYAILAKPYATEKWEVLSFTVKSDMGWQELRRK